MPVRVRVCVCILYPKRALQPSKIATPLTDQCRCLVFLTA